MAVVLNSIRQITKKLNGWNDCTQDSGKRKKKLLFILNRKSSPTVNSKKPNDCSRTTTKNGSVWATNTSLNFCNKYMTLHNFFPNFFCLQDILNQPELHHLYLKHLMILKAADLNLVKDICASYETVLQMLDSSSMTEIVTQVCFYCRQMQRLMQALCLKLEVKIDRFIYEITLD